MRRGNNFNFLYNNGKLCGMSLGANSVSEHEWGIAGIYKSFGVSFDSSLYGVEKRAIKKVPENLVYKEFSLEGEKRALLILSYEEDFSNENMECILQGYELNTYGKNISCAWDDHSFGVLVNEENIENLKTIYNAIKELDCFIGIAPRPKNDFEIKSYGLCFAITSAVSDQTKTDLYEKDFDKDQLWKAAFKNGLKEKLSNARKYYFALSPMWKNDSKTEVVYWLNPTDQENDNYGWFTEQDLLDWIDGKGPIPKNRKSVSI